MMLDDDEVPPEKGELGYRIAELRIEHQMRTLLAILIVFGVVAFGSLLGLALLLS